MFGSWNAWTISVLSILPYPASYCFYLFDLTEADINNGWVFWRPLIWSARQLLCLVSWINLSALHRSLTHTANHTLFYRLLWKVKMNHGESVWLRSFSILENPTSSSYWGGKLEGSSRISWNYYMKENTIFAVSKESYFILCSLTK